MEGEKGHQGVCVCVCVCGERKGRGDREGNG